MKSKTQLESYVRRSVPLCRQMGVRIGVLKPSSLSLKLPLKPNRNHIGTGFGGTLIAAQALACWAWLSWRLENEGLKFIIVIQHCDHDFLNPVDQDFIAQCEGLSPTQFKSLLKNLRLRGRATVELGGHVKVGRRKCCRFTGRYVVKVQAQK